MYLTFDNTEDPDDQNYYVYLYHGTKDGQTQTKQIQEVIRYVEEGTNHEIAPAHQTSTITFTRTEEQDAVTGDFIKWSNWNASINTFAAVNNPKVANYTVDAKNVSQKLNGSTTSFATITADQVNAINFTQDMINNLPEKGVAQLEIVVPYTSNYLTFK
ncbi:MULTISPECIES: hypothetical protein [Lactobacillus]|uniref:Mub B2-like domain-containing protein n=1 Tax=Lactobacillus xujianguonis TaxID=2495899 RepID=A0A437SVN6_9LACO|nr:MULTISPECIES: hypothetical protein [Lactobacillus]RVU70988.1 hypothetical protein EJK17_04600 [Lactobacillus xujianguonis]RVU73942.1 hypothetical protein EJK20_05710 [Lactobacillus xujianguonis]